MELKLEALTPEEMYFHAVQPKRGFESAPSKKSDPVEAMRRQPSTIPAGAHADDKGFSIGRGDHTVGAIQIVDKDGRQIGFATGLCDQGNKPDMHAEPIALRGLVKTGPQVAVDGGKMIVVVEQTVCAHCMPKLIEYAKQKGLSEIEIHHPRGDKLNLSEARKLQMTPRERWATPKTVSRTSYQKGRTITVEFEQRIKLPPRSGPTGGSLPPGGLRTSIAGSVLGLVAGLLANLVLDKFKESMLKDLENMPRPKVDTRSAQQYLTDPNTAKAIKTVDLLQKNLSPFASQLAAHHEKVIKVGYLEIGALALSSLSTASRLEYTTGSRDEVELYLRQLLTIRDNLEAALELESESLKAAQAAEELYRMMDSRVSEEWLFKQGFSPEEMLGIKNALQSYSSRVRKMFADMNALRRQVEEHIPQCDTLASTLNKLQWSLFFEKAKESAGAAGQTP